jgi:CRP-like cAMP-binding protein
MARVQYDERLAQHPLLEDCSRRELAMLSRHATPLRLPKGKRIMSQGAFGSEFVMLETGTASVTVNGEQVAELSDGDFCGEMALLDGEYTRSADVVAETDISVFVFDPRGFHQMMEEVPLAAERILEAFEDRRN